MYEVQVLVKRMALRLQGVSYLMISFRRTMCYFLKNHRVGQLNDPRYYNNCVVSAGTPNLLFLKHQHGYEFGKEVQKKIKALRSHPNIS